MGEQDELTGIYVRRGLDPDLAWRVARELMAKNALAAHARGEAYQPLRTVTRPPGAAGLMALMPSYLPPPAGQAAAEPGYGVKVICITPGNPALGQDAHQGVVLISSAQTGEPLALVNASALTEIRTAAVSALATSLLARPDATELAVIGTGVQARAHIQALAACREAAARAKKEQRCTITVPAQDFEVSGARLR